MAAEGTEFAAAVRELINVKLQKDGRDNWRLLQCEHW